MEHLGLERCQSSQMRPDWYGIHGQVRNPANTAKNRTRDQPDRKLTLVTNRLGRFLVMSVKITGEVFSNALVDTYTLASIAMTT